MSQDDRTTCSFCEEKPASHVILDRPACSSCSETVCGFYRGEAVADLYGNERLRLVR
jgi:hypothetical protein